MILFILEEIRKIIPNHWDKEIAEISPEKFRLETPFKYLDGGSVELFLIQKNREKYLTDLGETTSWLFHAQREYNNFSIPSKIQRRGGELVFSVSSIEEVIEGLDLLGKTCSKVSGG